MNRKVILIGAGLSLAILILGRKRRSDVSYETNVPIEKVEPLPQAIFTEHIINAPTDSPRKIPGRIVVRRNTTVNPTQDVLRLTNVFRASGGICGGQRMPAVGPLQWDDRLARSALNHAQDMANQGYFDHISPQGSRPEQRIAAAGWTIYPIGENIAAGQSTADEVIQSWKDSPGHCRNMLDGKYHHIGIAYFYAANSQYKHYWVQNFGG